MVISLIYNNKIDIERPGTRLLSNYLRRMQNVCDFYKRSELCSSVFVCLLHSLSSYNHMVYEFTLPMASGGCGSYTASGSGISGSGTK